MIDATAVALLLLEELDYAQELYECYGETYAQYLAELNHYGDAWPGSYGQIMGMQDAMSEMEKVAELVYAISPPWVSSFTPLTEEPF